MDFIISRIKQKANILLPATDQELKIREQKCHDIISDSILNTWKRIFKTELSYLRRESQIVHVCEMD